MSVERAYNLYKRKLDFLVNKREKELQVQDQADYDNYIKRQKKVDDLIASISMYNNIAKARLSAPTLKMQETYMEGGEALPKYEMREGGEFGPLNPLRLIPGGEKFEPRKYFDEYDFGEELGKEYKQLTRPVKETEGYKQFQADKEASELSLKEARGIEVLDDVAGVAPEEVKVPDVTRGIPKVDDVVSVPMATGGEMPLEVSEDPILEVSMPEDPMSIVTEAPIPEVPIPEAAMALEAPIPEAPITPAVPDAKPGLMEKGYGATKKLGTMENMQNAYNLYNIGQTIRDKDATGEEKGVATVQATKMLADLAAKQGKEATVGQLGSKAASDYFAKKGLQEGVKLTGKQAVGAAAGGVLGGYTMVTEGKEAVESWEEKDYDEAILHGIGSVSGGLQAAGAGMMLSGVGAPLGLILYGAGTAGSVISSVGGFIEGLFGGDDRPAPEQPKRPKVHLRQYYKGIMDRDPYGDYLRYGR